VKAHTGFVRGCVSTLDGANVLTCGDDKTIKLWKPTEQSVDAFGGGDRHIRKSKDEDDETLSNSFLTRARPGQPLQTYMGQHAFTFVFFLSLILLWICSFKIPSFRYRAIDHQHGTGSTTFATAGVQLDLWDHERS
jgi:WD40 repeat protein